jgi:hypothetical protein
VDRPRDRRRAFSGDSPWSPAGTLPAAGNLIPIWNIFQGIGRGTPLWRKVVLADMGQAKHRQCQSARTRQWVAPLA